MKQLLLALLLVSLASSSALADSPDAILKDYRKAATQAVERLNLSLKNTTTLLITKLVSSGDTEGAELLTSQLKAKLAGELVPSPQASATQLFSLYDDARDKALAPVQKSSISRIDSLLKTAGGAKLETIAELGRVRAEIEGGAVKDPSPSSYLDKHNIPKVWGYYVSNKYDVRHGTLNLNDDGTMTIEASNPVTGTWLKTPNLKVISVSMKNSTNVEEKSEIIILNGVEATMKRLSGVKYLKAD
jgi:hypothetical protein